MSRKLFISQDWAWLLSLALGIPKGPSWLWEILGYIYVLSIYSREMCLERGIVDSSQAWLCSYLKVSWFGALKIIMSSSQTQRRVFLLSWISFEAMVNYLTGKSIPFVSLLWLVPINQALITQNSWDDQSLLRLGASREIWNPMYRKVKT